MINRAALGQTQGKREEGIPWPEVKQILGL